MEYDLVDTIENGIIDYLIRKEIKTGDIPFSIFEMSIHVNDYVNIKLNESRVK